MARIRFWWSAPPGTEGTLRGFGLALALMVTGMAGLAIFALQPRVQVLQTFEAGPHVQRQGVVRDWDFRCTRKCSSRPPVVARVALKADPYGPAQVVRVGWQKRTGTDSYTEPGWRVPVRCLRDEPWRCERPLEGQRELRGLRTFQRGLWLLGAAGLLAAVFLVVSLWRPGRP